MSRFGTKRIGALALAVAGITTIAACSSSGSSGSAASTSSSGGITQPGSIGVVPAAGTPSGTAGTITYGYLATNAPTWILPQVTAAFNSWKDGTGYVASIFAGDMTWEITGRSAVSR